MMRFARIVSCAVIAVLAYAAPGRAQTAAADASRYYAEFNVAATVGHKSSGAVGVEGGYRITGPYTVFVEGGRMFNVGTSALDARATGIANAVAENIGANVTSSSSYKVNFFDAGLRYEPKQMLAMLHPYLSVGVGVASVHAETALAVNGTTVPAETVGVAFGDDLNGTVGKPMLMIGGGVTYPIANRYFVDGTYRYGRIFPRTSVIEGDKGINTSRFQIGFGARF